MSAACTAIIPYGERWAVEDPYLDFIIMLYEDWHMREYGIMDMGNREYTGGDREACARLSTLEKQVKAEAPSCSALASLACKVLYDAHLYLILGPAYPGPYTRAPLEAFYEEA